MSKEKFLVKALVELKYFVWGENEDEELLTRLEEGELDVMLSKDTADVMYVDNQSCRFDNVDIRKVEVTKICRTKTRCAKNE